MSNLSVHIFWLVPSHWGFDTLTNVSAETSQCISRRLTWLRETFIKIGFHNFCPRNWSHSLILWWLCFPSCQGYSINRHVFLIYVISWCCLNGQWSHPTPSAQHCLLTPAESPRQVHFMVLEFWPTPRTIWDLPVGTGSIIPEDPEKPRTTQCFCTPTLVFHDPNTKKNIFMNGFGFKFVHIAY